MEEEIAPVRRRRPRVRMILLALLILIFLLLLLAWVQRRNIATGFIDRELAKRGVQANYEITQLSPWRQRLENVVIGNPANPDLTAKRVDVQLSLGFRAPRVSKITARGVRLKGRLVGGRLKLGQIDRLLPPPTGAPFSLPDLVVDVADTTMRLQTPAGAMGLALEGKGNLSDGFRGRLAAVAPRLAMSTCAVDRPRALVKLAVADRKPSIQGPVRAVTVDCGSDLHLTAPRVSLDARLAEALDGWTGKADMEMAALRSGTNRAGQSLAKLSFAGDAALTKGRLEVNAADASLAGVTVAQLGLDGDYRFAMRTGRAIFEGQARSRGTAAGREVLTTLNDSLDTFAGLPLEPIGKALAQAAVRAGRAFDAESRFRIEHGPDGGAVRIASLGLTSASGARLTIGGGQGMFYRWPDGNLALAANLELSGGGFPAVQAQLSQPRPGAGMRGTARVAPFSAGDARLALGTVHFEPGAGGRTMIRSAAMIDGPVSAGRVEGLSFPLAGWIGSNGFAFGEGCIRARFASFQLDQLRLGPAQLPLCPLGRAIVWQQGSGGVRGGVQARNLRLAGQLGGTALSIAPERLSFDISKSSFAASQVAIRLGSGGYLNRLDLARLDGAFVRGGITGRFAGGTGKIANVPLLISEAEAKWQLVGGEAAFDGGVTVADEVEPARFHPLRSNDFHLTISGNRIAAEGWLEHPQTGTRVARATITHALDSGSGRALLDVPGIRFSPDFQPERLTRLTTGVIALVDGTMSGNGEIAWSREGTRSTGSFSTADMDLAAPFGPVSGLKGTIHFSDLLGLQTEPGQVVEMEEVQAGITVFDGRVTYQLLPDLRIRVQSGHWPYAGGDLALDETILDFGKPSDKHLTFRITGMDAAAFVQQMDFKNINATGTFDGVIPMLFDARGGHIQHGRLVARQPGGVVSYIGELTDKQLGAYGKLAFDALKSLSYDKLTVDLDGSLDGEFLAGIELDGIAREAPNPGGIAGVALRQLAKIPFEFNIKAKGRFRALMSMMRSFEDPTPLLQQALARERLQLPASGDVQVQESEEVP